MQASQSPSRPPSRTNGEPAAPAVVPTPPSSEPHEPEIGSGPRASPGDQPSGRSGRRPFLILGAIALVVLAGVGGYALLTANQETTDDAFVEADVVPIGVRVGAQVKSVLVSSDQPVKKGQPLVELDDAELRARTKQAEAELDTAKAQAAAADARMTIDEAAAKGGYGAARALVAGSAEQVSSAAAQVTSAEANLRRAEAEARRSQLELGREKELFARGAIAKAEFDNAEATDDAARAAVDQANAELAAARQGRRVASSHVAEARGKLDQSAPVESQIDVARANAALAHARVESAQAALELSRVQLSYATIVAPSDGTVSRVSVHPGQLVQMGQIVGEFVPKESYVVANFKETQLARLAPGQPVKIALDAYPGVKFEGTLASVSAGTGSRFALLPADNASGNFVKVVQRVPVRVAWSAPPELPMRAGLSAEVTVYVKR